MSHPQRRKHIQRSGSFASLQSKSYDLVVLIWDGVKWERCPQKTTSTVLWQKWCTTEASYQSLSVKDEEKTKSDSSTEHASMLPLTTIDTFKLLLQNRWHFEATLFTVFHLLLRNKASSKHEKGGRIQHGTRRPWDEAARAGPTMICMESLSQQATSSPQFPGRCRRYDGSQCAMVNSPAERKWSDFDVVLLSHM